MRDSTKRHLFNSAKSCISCAHFEKGQYISVEYDGIGYGGIHWYKILIKGREVALYPEHHLSDFSSAPAGSP